MTIDFCEFGFSAQNSHGPKDATENKKKFVAALIDHAVCDFMLEKNAANGRLG